MVRQRVLAIRRASCRVNLAHTAHRSLETRVWQRLGWLAARAAPCPSRNSPLRLSERSASSANAVEPTLTQGAGVTPKRNTRASAPPASAGTGWRPLARTSSGRRPTINQRWALADDQSAPAHTAQGPVDVGERHLKAEKKIEIRKNSRLWLFQEFFFAVLVVCQ